LQRVLKGADGGVGRDVAGDVDGTEIRGDEVIIYVAAEAAGVVAVAVAAGVRFDA